MPRRRALVPLALLGICVAGCGKKSEPVVQPIPAAGPTTPGTGTSATPGPARPEDASGAAAATRAALIAELGTVIHFDYDQDAIKPEDRPLLDRKAAILQANPALRIRISGHADERGSDEYNLVLGNKRSVAAKQYLMGKGIDASRLDVTSFGEERPVDASSTEAAWTKNRRDEFEIVAGGDRLMAPR
jgi:peptidoglycan-associated lipoprotein